MFSEKPPARAQQSAAHSADEWIFQFAAPVAPRPRTRSTPRPPARAPQEKKPFDWFIILLGVLLTLGFGLVAAMVSAILSTPGSSALP